MKGKKACPLAARIKKLLQADDDVGKIAQATPVMLAKAMELFLQRLCEKTAAVAQARQAKTVTTSHLKACVSCEETLDFLKELVASAPDLPPAEAASESAKPPKRRRSAAAVAASQAGDGGEGTDAAAPAPVKRSRAKASKAAEADTTGEAAQGDGEGVEAGEGEHMQVDAAPKRKGRQPSARQHSKRASAKADTVITGDAVDTSLDDPAGATGAGDGQAGAGSKVHRPSPAPPSPALHMQGLDAPSVPPVHILPTSDTAAAPASSPAPATKRGGGRGGGRGKAKTEPAAGEPAGGGSGVQEAGQGQGSESGQQQQQQVQDPQLVVKQEALVCNDQPDTSPLPLVPSEVIKGSIIILEPPQALAAHALSSAAAAAAVISSAGSSPQGVALSAAARPGGAGAVALQDVPACPAVPGLVSIKHPGGEAGAAAGAAAALGGGGVKKERSSSVLRGSLAFALRKPPMKKQTQSGAPDAGAQAVPAASHTTQQLAGSTPAVLPPPATLKQEEQPLPVPAAQALSSVASAQLPILPALDPISLPPPVLPNTAHLAHMQVANSLQYDDDYDNL